MVVVLQDLSKETENISETKKQKWQKWGQT